MLLKYFYNKFGQLSRTEISAMNWMTLVLEPSDKTEYAYDGDGDVLTSTDYYWEAEQWEPDYRDNYFYFDNLNFNQVAFPYTAYAFFYATMNELMDEFIKAPEEYRGYTYIDGDFEFADTEFFYYSPTSGSAEEYTLTYIAGENGEVIGETTQTVTQGSSGSEVEAVPDEGYHFTEWSDGKTSSKRTDTNVTSDITVTAFFALNTYTITATANNESFGSVTGDGEYTHGQSATLVATSNNADAYVFINWTENDLVVHEEAAYTFTVTENRNLVANFQNVTNVSEALQNPSINTYPNPANHFVMIESPVMVKNITVYDTSGRQLVFVVVNDKRYELNTSSLKTGAYILQATTAEGYVTSRFLIE